MFLELLFTLIIHQSLSSANPFHKYPYVFLLDIGNEELQTNSQQIRISIPGGSLAVRYPAVGEGDNIAHVRVSGIDFGTDLKASIIDGGPGYKYVVIVFMGNPGQAYDAIVTVSTLDEEKDTEVEDTNPAQRGVKISYKVAEDSDEEDSNNSSEADEPKKREEEKNEEDKEQLTSASNFYDSAENIDVNGKEDESDEDIHVANDETVTNDDDRQSEQVSNDNVDIQDYADAVHQDENRDYDDNDPNGGKYVEVQEERVDENNQDPREIQNNLYNKYSEIRPHLYVNGKIYPQEINNAQNEVDYDVNNDNRVMYSPGDPSELDQMFNDEEVHNDGEKYTDSNNNNRADEDESSAVEY